MYRKVLIIFLIGYTKLSNEAKSMVVLVILFFLLWQQARDNPYLTEDLNSVDFKATFVAFFTIFGGLFSYLTNNDAITVIVIVIILSSNILFMIIWLKRILILRSNVLLHNKYLQCFTPFLQKINYGLLKFSSFSNKT